MRRWIGLPFLLLVLVAPLGCTGSATQSSPDPGPTLPRGVALSAVQQHASEGTVRVQLRVSNRSTSEVSITGVGLSWPGFGTFLRDYDTGIGPQSVRDLDFDLPPPMCDVSPAPSVLGQIDIDGHLVRAELDATGSEFIRGIWQGQCVERRVAQAFRIEYGDQWQLLGTGRRARLRGHFTLVRRESDQRVVVPTITGSVLLDLHLTRPAVLPRRTQRRRFALTMTVPRCDAHALIESSRTFNFTVFASIGAGTSAHVLRPADSATRRAAQALLTEACG